MSIFNLFKNKRNNVLESKKRQREIEEQGKIARELALEEINRKNKIASHTKIEIIKEENIKKQTELKNIRIIEEIKKSRFEDVISILKEINNPSEEICISAIRRNYSYYSSTEKELIEIFKYIKNPTEQIWIEAIKKCNKSENLFKLIKDPSEEICKIAIQRSTDVNELFELIKDPSEEICIKALYQISHNFYQYPYNENIDYIKKYRNKYINLLLKLFKSIENPTDNICITAIKCASISAIISKDKMYKITRYGYDSFLYLQDDIVKIFKSIENPTENVCIEAVKIYSKIISEIKNPTEAMYLAAIENSIIPYTFEDNRYGEKWSKIDLTYYILSTIKKPTQEMLEIALAKSESTAIRILELSEEDNEEMYLLAMDSIKKYRVYNGSYGCVGETEILKLGKNITEKRCLEAIEQGRLLSSIMRNIENPTEKVCLAAIEKAETESKTIDDELMKVLEAIENPTEKVYLAAIKKVRGDWCRIIYNYNLNYIGDKNIYKSKIVNLFKLIKNPTPEICINLIKKAEKVYTIEELIKRIKNPTEEMYLEVIKVASNFTSSSDKSRLMKLILMKSNQTPNICFSVIEFIICNNSMFEFEELFRLIEKPTEDMYLKVVNLRGDYIKYIKNPTTKVILEAISTHYEMREKILNHIDILPDEIVNYLLSRDIENIKYIKNIPVDKCLEIVKDRSDMLKYIVNINEEICLEAIRRDPNVLKYVQLQTTEMCLEAIKINPRVLKYVTIQSEELCIEAMDRCKSIQDIIEVYNSINSKSEVILEYRDYIIENKLKYENVEYDKTEIIEKYKLLLHKSSLGILTTAECLYNNNIKFVNENINDYSHIYIMYSKLLETELSICINVNKLSLGGIIFKLKKECGWDDFLEEFEYYEILKLRNDAAHKGVIKISDVNKIREFLFEKEWLDFIINKSYHNY